MGKGKKIEIGKGCAAFVHNIYQMNDYSLKKTKDFFGISPGFLKKSMSEFGFYVKSRPNFWEDGGAICGMCKEFKTCDHYSIMQRNGGIYRASGFCIECNKKRRINYISSKIGKDKMNKASKQYYRDVMDGKYGEEKRNKMVLRQYNNSVKRRRIKSNSAFERIDRIKVFEKDNWVCYICGILTTTSKKYKPNRATLDHIIPLTKGGSHTYDNVRCCCNRCNIKKGNRTTTASRTASP